MTKHTPGPWDFIVLEDYDLEGITFENGYVKRESYFICEIIEWNATAEDVANARLIAAAPQLLEALRRIMNELGVPQPGYPQPVANAYEIAEEAIAAAIAAATDTDDP